METYKIQIAVIECNEDKKEGKTRYAYDMKLKSNEWFEVNKEFYAIFHRAGTSVRNVLALKAGLVYLRVRMIEVETKEIEECFYIDIE